MAITRQPVMSYENLVRLSPEDLLANARLSFLGNKEARGRTVLHFLPACYKQAQWQIRNLRRNVPGVELDDLAHQAAAKLMERLPEFDPDRDEESNGPGKVISFCNQVIFTAIRRMAVTGRTISVPDFAYRSMMRGESNENVDAARRAYASVNNEFPHLAKAEDHSPGHVRDQDELEVILCRVEKPQADILRSLFGIDTGIDITLQEHGRRVGYTRERARQRRNDALEACKLVAMNLK